MFPRTGPMGGAPLIAGRASAHSLPCPGESGRDESNVPFERGAEFYLERELFREGRSPIFAMVSVSLPSPLLL